MRKSIVGSFKKLHLSKKTPEGSETESNPPAGEEAPPSYEDALRPNSLVVPPPTSRAVARSSRAASPAPSVPSSISMQHITRVDDEYAFLSTFDTVFVIDDSYSMIGDNWNEVQAVLRCITPICTAHDSDGIDIYFLNHRTDQLPLPKLGKPGSGYRNVTSPKQVRDLFNVERNRNGDIVRGVAPSYATPIGQTLHRILKPYTSHYAEEARKAEARGDYEVNVKPMNIIVITDGQSTDPVEDIIVPHARKLDKAEAPPYQVGIQFFQVGKDRGATEFLRKLDDELANKEDIRDMIDTVTWDDRGNEALSEKAILKVVLGSVVRRLDRSTGRASQDSRRSDIRPRGRY